MHVKFLLMPRHVLCLWFINRRVNTPENVCLKFCCGTQCCSELEMEINLGIEEILPATVKPDKTPIYDMSSDYDEDLDKLTQNNVFG